jgi:hypothetical protein
MRSIILRNVLQSHRIVTDHGRIKLYKKKIKIK